MNRKNPFAKRLEDFQSYLEREKLDAALVFDEANVYSLTGEKCDNACLLVRPGGCVFHTDFRYTPAVNRHSPWLRTDDIAKLSGEKPYPRARNSFAKIGYEPSIAHSRYLKLAKSFPGAKFINVSAEISRLRAIKTPQETAKIKAAAALNDEIWQKASKHFKPGMTEREMALSIKREMLERGDGEAFDTIVCIGRNAAECHHVPDATKWNGRESILVDMGVKLDGYCSDMTRCIKPVSFRGLYAKVYAAVLEANALAMAAAKPGITGAQLDAAARRHIAKCGFGKAFGHSLGHGVGVEVHEAPSASKKSKTVLEPGMFVTIEPGIYLEGNLGVRIEDLVLITKDGCECVSHSAK